MHPRAKSREERINGPLIERPFLWPDICYVERPYRVSAGQHLSQLCQELSRRNVFRVAIAYLAVAWVIMQLADRLAIEGLVGN